MGTISDKFRRVRLDQSPYLFHFTKGNKKEAKEALYSILSEKKLKSSEHDYVCFTASPITALHDFFKTKVNKTDNPLYQPYAIGFSRDLLIQKFGARNVIYCDSDELDLIPKGMTWRSQLLNIYNYDFEYLREWRIKGNVF